MATRVYGVSFGNGNDGVSQMFPSMYMRTDDPFKLARVAMISEFVEGSAQRWAKDAVVVDGDPDFTVSASLYEGPEGETEFGAAWMICEVFPVEWLNSDPVAESLSEYFSEEAIALASD